MPLYLGNRTIGPRIIALGTIAPQIIALQTIVPRITAPRITARPRPPKITTAEIVPQIIGPWTTGAQTIVPQNN